VIPSLPHAAGASVGQIGILVPNLDHALASYVEALDIKPWRVWQYDRGFVKEMTYRGEPASYAFRIALTSTQPQLELIEWLDGACVFEASARTGHFGLNHIGLYVPSLEEALAAMRREGRTPVQTGIGYGADGDGGFAYFDMEDELAITVELIEAPARRREALFTYP
jgi:catechol 2,3-dioxygenase-like lactoylglutathione lyase family enzyme